MAFRKYVFLLLWVVLHSAAWSSTSATPPDSRVLIQSEKEKYRAGLTAIPPKHALPQGLIFLIVSYAYDPPKLRASGDRAVFFANQQLFLFDASRPLAKELEIDDIARQYYDDDPYASKDIAFDNQLDAKDVQQVEVMRDTEWSMLILNSDGAVSYANGCKQKTQTGWQGACLAPTRFFDAASGCLAPGDRVRQLRVGCGRFPPYYLVTRDGALFRGKKTQLPLDPGSSGQTVEYTSDGKISIKSPGLEAKLFPIMSQPTLLMRPSEESKRVVDVATLNTPSDCRSMDPPERIFILFKDGTVELGSYSERTNTLDTIGLPLPKGEDNLAFKSIDSRGSINVTFNAVDERGGAWLAAWLYNHDTFDINSVLLFCKLSRIPRTSSFTRPAFKEVSSNSIFSVLRCHDNRVVLYDHGWPDVGLLPFEPKVPETAGKILIQVHAVQRRCRYVCFVYEDGSLLKFRLPLQTDSKQSQRGHRASRLVLDPAELVRKTMWEWLVLAK
jgi:hypothetical protein